MSVARKGGEPHAVWRRGTGDPTTVSGWIMRGGEAPSPDKAPIKPDYRKIQFIVGGFCLYAVLTFVLSTGFPKLARFILPVVNCVVMIATPLLLNHGKKSVPTDPRDELWVQLEVQNRHGMKTGSDWGFLVHCDGWLVFEGRRTDIALTRGEAVRAPYAPAGHLSLEDGRRIVFGLPGLATEQTGDGPVLGVLREWDQAPIPEGQAVLPPLEYGIDVWAERSGLCIAGALIAFFLGGMALAYGFPIVAALVVGVGVPVCLWAASAYAKRVGRELQRLSLGISAFPTNAHALVGALSEGSKTSDELAGAVGKVEHRPH